MASGDGEARDRPAATIVVARPGQGGVKVLMLRRSAASRFVPGFLVFPGGAIDPGDEIRPVIFVSHSEHPARDAQDEVIFQIQLLHFAPQHSQAGDADQKPYALRALSTMRPRRCLYARTGVAPGRRAPRGPYRWQRKDSMARGIFSIV